LNWGCNDCASKGKRRREFGERGHGNNELLIVLKNKKVQIKAKVKRV
jgi:hypothetical protein